MLEIINPFLDHTNLELRPRYPEILRCRIRILIISDDNIFHRAEREFSLTELIEKSLQSTGSGVQFEVATAYRPLPGDPGPFDDSAQSPPGFIIDFPDYRLTDTQTSSTGKPPLRADGGEFPWNYDQVWLMGYAGYVLSPEDAESVRLKEEELEILTRFMNDGGGVFAAGDHEDLGILLSGEVPRVRSMRKWWFYDPELPLDQVSEHEAVRNASAQGLPIAPPVDGPDRNDTSRSGFMPDDNLRDDADAIPQKIEPILFSSSGGSARSGVPHPLLGKPGGVIRVMPDHMHEGECIVPKDLAQPALRHSSEFGDEYPLEVDPVDPVEPGDRARPVLVAVGRSETLGSGGATELFSPFTGRPFGLICVYEGPQAGVGRVAVQSTWHHFTNYNLNGAGSGSDDLNGLYLNGQPTPELREVERYHRNLAYWLFPNTWCLVTAGLYSLRLSFPFLEVLPREMPLDYGGSIKLGRIVRKSLYELSAPTDAYIAAALLLERAVPKIPRVWLRTLKPWEGVRGLPLLPAEDLMDAVLGGAMNALGGLVPLSGKGMLDPKTEPAKVRELVAAALTKGAQRGWKHFAERLQKDAKRLLETMPR